MNGKTVFNDQLDYDILELRDTKISGYLYYMLKVIYKGVMSIF
jgi:hypothetical protein